MKSSQEKVYDLEERTFAYAQRIRFFIKTFPKTVTSIEDCKQLTRSSGSVAANYIEARESLSKKDRILRLKIARKEAKESKLWIKLLKAETPDTMEQERQSLEKETHEIELILGSMVRKLETP